MLLIDSSVWIDALRQSGPVAVRTQLAKMIESGEAAWCAAIRLELWAGIRNDQERKILHGFGSVVMNLEITETVWEHAINLAEIGRKRGQTFPYPDLVIFACAKVHRAQLFHRDTHFDALAKLQG
jgi:Predicted nucleic acid-binding protein, contains PIN domain